MVGVARITGDHVLQLFTEDTICNLGLYFGVARRHFDAFVNPITNLSSVRFDIINDRSGFDNDIRIGGIIAEPAEQAFSETHP